MKNILIVGGSGFIGLKLIELKPDNVSVTATYNTQKKDSADVAWEKNDLLDSAETKKLLTRIKPEIIINVSKAESEAIDPIVAYAKQNKIRLIHLSSDAVFDGVLGNYKEEDATQPITDYGKGKLEEELKIKDTLIDYAIIRTSYVYGKSGGEWDKRTKNIIAIPRVTAYSNMFRTPTLVDDLAKQIWAITLGDQKGIFHVAGKRMNMPEFFLMLGGLTGINVDIEEKECIDDDIALDTSLVNSKL